MSPAQPVAFLSANRTTPGVACELFFLDAAPRVGGAAMRSGADD